MKTLLLDHNLSPRLIRRLADLYPNSDHVSQLGLAQASDHTVWSYAREHEHIIVTKDADFSDLLSLHGFPPKIIWIRRGNCTTNIIEELLRNNYETIEMLGTDTETGILTIF